MAVSYTTAVKLQAAKFPQPELEIGQFWYVEAEYKGGKLEHNPLCIVVENSDRKKVLRRLTCEGLTGEYGGKPEVFAPTATDILKDFLLCNISFNREGNKWYACFLDRYFCNRNSAEAVAEAYLFYYSISEEND